MGTVLENSHGCSCRSLVGLRRVVWGCRVWVGGNMWYATMKLGSRVTHLCVSPPLDIADRGKKKLCWFCVLVDVGETFVQAKPRNNLLAGDQF